jgi:hypothetical protein
VDGKVLGRNPVMEDGLWWSCQRKERVGEWFKKKKERHSWVGCGRKTTASIQGQRVRLGRAAAVCCF